MTTRTLLSILALSSLAALPAAAAPEKVPTKAGSTEGVARTAPPQQLKPGEYVWHPEASPVGPLVIVVSIPDQRANVYRNGVIIGATTVSTGKKGHETPTGVFTVLEKDADHRHRRDDDQTRLCGDRLREGTRGPGQEEGLAPPAPAQASRR